MKFLLTQLVAQIKGKAQALGVLDYYKSIIDGLKKNSGKNNYFEH
jgi:hypothetical protein